MALTGLTIAVALSGCGSSEPGRAATPTRSASVPTTRAPAPTTAAPTPARWPANGVLTVGEPATTKTIPPGRYAITMTNASLGALTVVRCSALPCSLSENFIAGDSGYGADYTSVIDIAPTDAAVRLQNATLTPE